MAILQPRDYVLHPSAARTVSGVTTELQIPGGFTAAIIRLQSAAGVATTPTLDVYLQQGIKDVDGTEALHGFSAGAYVFNDLVAFAQVTDSASEQWAMIVGGGSQVAAAQDAALTASSILDGPIGGVWRLKWVIGGTGPSFTFDVVAQLIP